MGRRWRAVPILAAVLATPAPAWGGDGLWWRARGVTAGSLGDRTPRRGSFPILRSAPGVIAMPANARPDRFYRGPIRPFGSVHTGLDAGIGYGYPELDPTPGRAAPPRPRIPW